MRISDWSSDVCSSDFGDQGFVRLAQLAVDFLDDNLRPRNCDLVAFATHVFEQYAQVQQAAAGNAKLITGAHRLDARRDVGLHLPRKAITAQAGGDDLTFL